MRIILISKLLITHIFLLTIFSGSPEFFFPKLRNLRRV